MTDQEFESQSASLDAQAAFNAFVANHGGVNGELAMNAWGNAFAVEVRDEYADDLQRWTVALGTAKEYVDQGVTGY
jgi:hypothetical protein